MRSVSYRDYLNDKPIGSLLHFLDGCTDHYTILAYPKFFKACFGPYPARDQIDNLPEYPTIRAAISSLLIAHWEAENGPDGRVFA